MSLADLDQDGRLDRVSVVREEGGFGIRLHEMRTLAEKRAYHVKGDSIELSITRWRARTFGDLWAYIGHRREGGRWEFSLHRLEQDQLEEVFRGGGRLGPNLRLDLDGDGRVDPIVTTRNGAVALLGPELTRTPIPAIGYAPGLHGAPAAYGLEETVDLDGDGRPDLLALDGDGLRILSMPGFESTFRHPAERAAVVRYAGAPALFVGTSAGARLLGVDGMHQVLARLDGVGYAAPLPRIDPAGDGSRLAVDVGSGSALVGAWSADGREPPSLERLDMTLASPAGPDPPRLGPVRLRAGGPAVVVGVRTLSRGSLLGLSTESAAYELVVRAPPGAGPGRVIGRGKLTGEGDATAQLVDLDGDGVHEILLREEDTWSTNGPGRRRGGKVALLLLGGDGRVVWRDEPRSFEVGGPGAFDERARVRTMDLLGDGSRVLQLRAPGKEWYVVPADAAMPRELPPCLE